MKKVLKRKSNKVTTKITVVKLSNQRKQKANVGKVLLRLTEYNSFIKMEIQPGTPLFDMSGVEIGAFRKMIGKKVLVSEKSDNKNSFVFRPYSPSRVRVELQTFSIPKRVERENDLYERMFN